MFGIIYTYTFPETKCVQCATTDSAKRKLKFSISDCASFNATIATYYIGKWLPKSNL